MTAPVSYVAVCTAFDEAQACTETVWMPYASGAVPSLSIAAAQDLGLAIAGLWAIAWGIRMVKRVLNEAH
jgi:hypothetical protein